MQTRTLPMWLARRIAIRQRLERICTSYLLLLMVVTQQHSLEEAARFSGRHTSQCSKMLQAHAPVAIST
jgi:predicted transcriptional regulator